MYSLQRRRGEKADPFSAPAEDTGTAADVPFGSAPFHQLVRGTPCGGRFGYNNCNLSRVWRLQSLPPLERRETEAFSFGSAWLDATSERPLLGKRSENLWFEVSD